MSWTLEYDSTEQTLEAWGLREDLRLDRGNQVADRLTVSQRGDADDASSFAYGGAVIVRRDRTWNAGTEAWESGTVYFAGKCTDLEHIGDGPAEGLQYTFAGPWWDFEHLVFQQSWKRYDEGTSSLADISVSELFLGVTAAGAAQTTGAQVDEAVDWAITCGVSVQVGTIDAGVNIPSYNTRDLTVAEVIQQMLRWTPDAIAWFDYTTSPPTFHVKRAAALTNVDLTIGTSAIRSLRLKPRYDLQLPAVILRFKRVNDVNGTSWQDIFTQKYPVDATGQELGASVHTIELGGFRASVAVGSIVCETVDPTSATWWKKKEPILDNAKIDGLAISGSSVKDAAGNTVSLVTYPRELTQGQIAPWMSVNAVQVTVKALATYDLYADDAKAILLQKGRTKELSARITLTDAATGTYTNAESVDPAEAEPSGLAQAIYEAHATLQHDGEIALVSTDVPTGLGMGNKVSIVGGRAEWVNMLVQSVVEIPATGTIQLTVGGANQLGLADLIELLRVNRYRIVYNSPLSRSTGKPSGGVGEVTLGNNLPKENTTGGAGKAESFATAKLSGTDYIIGELDSVNSAFYLGTKDSTGVKKTTAAAVEMLLSTLGTRKAEFRWFYFKDSKDACSEKKMLILATEPEADV